MSLQLGLQIKNQLCIVRQGLHNAKRLEPLSQAPDPTPATAPPLLSHIALFPPALRSGTAGGGSCRSCRAWRHLHAFAFPENSFWQPFEAAACTTTGDSEPGQGWDAYMLTIVSMFSKDQQGPKLCRILPHQTSVLQVPGTAACVTNITACAHPALNGACRGLTV